MLKKEMMRASKDPLFLDDLNEGIKDFESVDQENAKGNSEERLGEQCGFIESNAVRNEKKRLKYI
jgi:hypothetical protein